MTRGVATFVVLALVGTTFGSPFSCTELLESNSTSEYTFPIMEISTLLGRDQNNSQYWERVEGKEGELKLNQTLNEITITCWAPFSFNIHFDGHLTNRDAVIQETAVYSGTGVYKNCFTAKLRFDALIEATGKYSCAGASHKHNKNSSVAKYIYVTSNAGQPGVLIARHLEDPIVIQPSETNETLIPCAVSDPKITPRLYRIDETYVIEKHIKNVIKNFWLPANVRRGKFHPKKGWMIPTEDCFVGYYKCNVTGNDGEVFIQVIKGNKNHTKGAHHHHHGSEHEQEAEPHRLTAEASTTIHDCIKENGTLKSYRCSSAMECNIRRCQRYDAECKDDKVCEGVDSSGCPATGSIVQCLIQGKTPVSMINAWSITDGKWQFWNESAFLPGLQLKMDTDTNNLDKSGKPVDDCYCYRNRCTFSFTCKASSMFLAMPVSLELVYLKSGEKIPATDIIIDVEDITSIASSKKKGILQTKAPISLPPRWNYSEIHVNCYARLWSADAYSKENVKHVKQTWSYDLDNFKAYSEKCRQKYGGPPPRTTSGVAGHVSSMKQLLVMSTAIFLMLLP